MKLIEPKVELIKQEGRLEGMLKHIELCGRTCYKSEDKMDEYTNKVFIHNLIERGHTAMLEHGTVYLTLTNDIKHCNKLVCFPWYYDNDPAKWDEVFSYVQWQFVKNPYSVVKLHQEDDRQKTTMCITTNYRVIVENGLEEIMNEFITEPTLLHEKRITLKFTTNIGVTREGNRMRANSIAEESTRYCNYTKEKFGEEINICPPVWINEEIGMLQTLDESEWMNWINAAIRDGNNPDNFNCDAITWYGMACAFAQVAYRNLIRLGWTPQQAREVLPLATKSEVIYTATTSQWKHFFNLRLFGKTGAPHPNMREIAEKASEVLKENGLWELIYKDR